MQITKHWICSSIALMFLGFCPQDFVFPAAVKAGQNQESRAFIPSKAAAPLTARLLLEQMPKDEQFGFITGVIEGLAYARFVQDGRLPHGMTCIRSWFYDEDSTLPKIQAALEEFRDLPVALILWVMVKNECGE